MLRLLSERNAEIIPRLHNSKHAEPADTLHCLGKELFAKVRLHQPKLYEPVLTTVVKYLELAKIKQLSITRRTLIMVRIVQSHVENPAC